MMFSGLDLNLDQGSFIDVLENDQLPVNLSALQFSLFGRKLLQTLDSSNKQIVITCDMCFLKVGLR